MTLVGELVTNINAREATREAGKATERTGSPRETASSIIIGMMIVAVTVLLEKMIFNIEIMNTMTKTIRNGGRDPILDNRITDNHLAAPEV